MIYHMHVYLYAYVTMYVCMCIIIPYRRKFSRHEKFTKSLKTGFSHLFIRDTTPDICESHANVFSIKLYSIRSIITKVH